jgi:hypothetical protein
VSAPLPPLAAATVPAQGGISILGLNPTVPAVGVQVNANVSLPGGISLGIGAAG